MTTPTTLHRPALRRLVGHYLEITLATVAGMLVKRTRWRLDSRGRQCH
jgi:hypothetical protein